jgi:signal transduction histidine kinase
MLSHELRNPLGALVTAARLLRDAPPDSDTYKRAQEVLERQTRQMTRLIEDLLDVSRLAMGKVTLALERLDLAQLAASVVETWRGGGRLERHDVVLHANSARVIGDRARLEQVVTNLLDNALKFTPPGRRITLEVKSENGFAFLCVADEGRGIEGADLERIFQPFVQGPQDESRSEGGLGVGLALVQRIVEMQGGSVHAESAGRDRGARIVVRLPLAPDESMLQAASGRAHGA